MASGHVNRTYRPNTWLHRPMLQNVKKVLANSEPSTHGNSPSRPFLASLCPAYQRERRRAGLLIIGANKAAAERNNHRVAHIGRWADKLHQGPEGCATI
jgi:hypothetical protein